MEPAQDATVERIEEHRERAGPEQRIQELRVDRDEESQDRERDQAEAEGEEATAKFDHAIDRSLVRLPASFGARIRFARHGCSLPCPGR